MQKITTRVFICASLVFGIAGILMILTTNGPDHTDSLWSLIITKIFFTSIFVILPSFALSVAARYLQNK